MKQFLKDWMLPLAMIAGALAYLACRAVPFLLAERELILGAVAIVQPTLIFCMLYLVFCRIDFSKLRIPEWTIWLIIIQGGAYCALMCLTRILPVEGHRVVVESAMLCMICPTATSASVVVRKLGGAPQDVVVYTIFISLLVSVLVPVTVPIMHPSSEINFVSASLKLLAKVFPLLLCPMIAGYITSRWMKRFCAVITRNPDLSFYLWAVALSLAIATTTRSIFHNTISHFYVVAIALASLVSCGVQFYLGKRIGRVYGDSITAGQSLGQKNTVLVIWMGYTFFTPVTSIAGGFYSVWHNVVNSYQLYRNNHQKSQKKG